MLPCPDTAYFRIVITISTVFTPLLLSLLREWLEPKNPDGSAMQIGDETKDWGAFATSGEVTRNEEEKPVESTQIAETTLGSDLTQHERRYRAPIGARLCDRLCFAKTLLELETPLVSLPQEQSELVANEDTSDAHTDGDT